MPTTISPERVDAFLKEARSRLGFLPDDMDNTAEYFDDLVHDRKEQEATGKSAAEAAAYLGISVEAADKLETNDELTDKLLDYFSNEASNINNGGPTAQAAYVLSSYDNTVSINKILDDLDIVAPLENSPTVS
jgi:hypothetical protein